MQGCVVKEVESDLPGFLPCKQTRRLSGKEEVEEMKEDFHITIF